MPEGPPERTDPVDELARRIRGGAHPRRIERAHLGAALRRLVVAATTTPARDAVLADATVAVERITDALGATSTRWPPGEGFGAGPGEDMFVTHPLLGAANPLAPPLRIELLTEGGGAVRVVGRAVYGPAHEGLPGRVYGGVIATAFDGMTIFAAVAGGHRGVTGSLDVRFRAPVPIGVELTYESTLERVSGRVARVRSRLLDGDGNLCAECEGTVVTPR